MNMRNAINCKASRSSEIELQKSYNQNQDSVLFSLFVFLPFVRAMNKKKLRRTRVPLLNSVVLFYCFKKLYFYLSPNEQRGFIVELTFQRDMKPTVLNSDKNI